MGDNDEPVITLNQGALAELGCREKKLVMIPEASHLSEVPGALKKVAKIAAEWFACCFAVGLAQIRQELHALSRTDFFRQRF